MSILVIYWTFLTLSPGIDMERRMSIGVTEKGINVLPKHKEIGDIKARLLAVGNTKTHTSSPAMNPGKKEIWPVANVKPMNAEKNSVKNS
jgi:hypothetical protein